MLNQVGDAIAEALLERSYGLYDYSMYPGIEAPHVVREEKTGVVIHRSHNPDSAHEVWQRLCRQHIARAAIEAMRTPSPEMLAAAHRNNHPRDSETWQTMIDAALTSGER